LTTNIFVSAQQAIRLRTQRRCRQDPETSPFADLNSSCHECQHSYGYTESYEYQDIAATGCSWIVSKLQGAKTTSSAIVATRTSPSQQSAVTTTPANVPFPGGDETIASKATTAGSVIAAKTSSVSVASSLKSGACGWMMGFTCSSLLLLLY
jgi:hypothetical protein